MPPAAAPIHCRGLKRLLRAAAHRPRPPSASLVWTIDQRQAGRNAHARNSSACPSMRLIDQAALAIERVQLVAEMDDNAAGWSRKPSRLRSALLTSIVTRL